MSRASRFLRGKPDAEKKLKKHFGGLAMEKIATASRTFPGASKVDVQVALEQFFAGREKVTLLGVHSEVHHETPTLAQMLTGGSLLVDIAPLQHEDVDIGEDEPIRCLVNGLWMAREKGMPFTVLLGPALDFTSRGGVHVELGVPQGERGLEFSKAFFRDLEARVHKGGTYRGRIISLEKENEFSGMSGEVKVHHLRPVRREEVILPAKTLTMLDRNFEGFLRAREHIKSLGLSAKKGLLFYGPPGTGKTHTIHYLATQTKDNTTLLITAEQVGLLDDYFRLARFLQPSTVVVEDVDLIARTREQIGGGGEEVLLNKLLNEMDGLREDADVLFILTTNRPDQLEPALASRPGRIDQAIEFPLPDEPSRAKLVKLDSRGMELSASLSEWVVRRTKGASPAFIKELMRRAAQFQFEQGGKGPLEPAAVDGALEEMLFTGGALNRKLLGGASAELGFAAERQAPFSKLQD